MKSACIAVALASMLAAIPARSAEIRTVRHGAWFVGAYTDDRTRAFSHCAANAPYNSGIRLVLSVHSNFSWAMGFGNDNWSMSAGNSVPITYRVDNFAPRSGTAIAASRTHAIVRLPDDTELFRQFRLGQTLFVDAGGTVVPFRLTGTSALLNMLLECARTRGASFTIPVAAPPPAPVPSPVQPNPPGQPADTQAADRRLEATQFVANLLGQGDMRGYRLITLSEMRQMDFPSAVRNADVAWLGDGTLGTLSAHANRDANALDAMAAEIIADDARACPGEFATARTTDPEMQNVRRLSTFCNVGSSPITLTYLLLPMPGRLVYQMTIAGRAGRTAASAEDQRLRDAVHAVVARHPALGPAPAPPRASGPVGISN